MSGAGPLDARLVIVGEAPGWNEDREGVPFVGKAGQLLDRYLADAGIDRREVFVTNVNRCRPPENRTPTRTEQKACRPYLDAELDLVKPEVVLLLGNSALTGVLGKSGILKHRGAAIERDGRAYLPTVHPAAVLRDPSYEQHLRADIEAAKRLLDGTNKPPVTTVHIVRTSEQLRDLLDLLKAVETPIAFDVETDRLEWWQPAGRLDTVAFAWAVGEAWVVPLEHPEQYWPDESASFRRAHFPIEGDSTTGYKGLRVALKGKRLIGHNVKFDLHWLRSRGVTGYAHFDTLLAAHLLDENSPHGLKQLARRYLGADAYEKDISFSTDPDKVTPLDALAEYNGKDADYTLRLYHRFKGELEEQPALKRIFTRLSMPALRALVDIEEVGFPVDTERLTDRHQQIQARIAELEEEMLQYVPTPTGQVIFEPPNFNSPVFLSAWLFEYLGLPVQEISAKTDRPSTAKASLHAIRDKHPVVPLLIEYRRWMKWRGTYTQNWLDRLAAGPATTASAVGPIPRIFPSYNITGTVTGRLSGDMQQVPRDPFIRSIFGAREGYVLLDADYSQVELRVAAMISGDTAMTEAYRRGDDLHTLTASAVTGKPAEQVTKQERQIAKSANFGLLFGMGARGFRKYSALSYGVEISQGQAEYTRNAFFQRYPGLVYWHDSMKRLVRAQGYVDSPIGRRRRLPAVNSTDNDMAAEAERQAINSPVQGFASDLTLLAMVLIHENLMIQARILGTVHDSIVLEVLKEHADDVARIVKQTMEVRVPHMIRQMFDYRLPVPLVADVKVSKWWGEA